MSILKINCTEISKTQSDLGTHTFNLSTQKAKEVRSLWVQDHPWSTLQLSGQAKATVLEPVKEEEEEKEKEMQVHGMEQRDWGNSQPIMSPTRAWASPNPWHH